MDRRNFKGEGYNIITRKDACVLSGMLKEITSYGCLVEFQSRGAMTEKTLLPRDVRTYGMDRTDESDDFVDRE